MTRIITFLSDLYYFVVYFKINVVNNKSSYLMVRQATCCLTRALFIKKKKKITRFVIYNNYTNYLKCMTTYFDKMM